MLEAVHEIGIYVHRFHNLDLFQQGWYQIKIRTKWEDDDYGTPSRVFQYEAPELGSEYVCGMWRIDETDLSFFTQAFRIKFSRQDVFLSVMVCFSLPITRNEGPSSSAVILKFELLHAPVLENGFNLQDSFDSCPAAVHEFRLPPEALLGLHSYCPVHFDAFHAVLVDVSIHISLLQGSVDTSEEVPSDSFIEDVTSEDHDESKKVLLVKGFLTARDILLEELQNISKAINQDLDMNDFPSMLEDKESFSFCPSAADNVESSVEVPINMQNVSEKWLGVSKFQNEEVLNSLSKDELLSLFHSFGSQLVYLWGIFQKFHRDHKTSILDFLKEQWAVGRRSEWSIWMIYSEALMPHQCISSEVDSSSHHNTCEGAPALQKLTEDPIQTATKRAELHRQSISQMKITSCAIQDMQIFGDPLRTPIVIVERVRIAPFLSSHQDHNTDIKLAGIGSKPIKKFDSLRRNSRVLKVVVFVHGFQGHHLDLRLVRNQWLLIEPKIHFLMSESNEEKTSGDFREMGLNLAQEVTSYIKKRMDKVTRSGNLESIKLSFVGHSLGNVIIRAALTESIMEPYLRYLYTYVSVSGPHLGYLYSSNSLFNSGLWVLKKLRGTQCIHQLTFSDDPDIENTFLYKLCKQKTLENFRNIILLSSPQDGYVPYHSARIEMCQASLMDKTRKGILFMDMLNNCLEQMYTSSSELRVIMRCDVNFDMSLQGRNLDTVIGRAAHIEFLDSDTFARLIMWSFPDMFR
ncbi:protein FAM135B-like isoform X1 [Ipomoea triloba]|uniref:protein FAM135B-like isoform X1 n=2 Tax=Ipomoea triloba TaxID=35885 RepID=UPI00125DC1ED|nr:protein FAM135B-like isoform X1 [Ipomoea triloba]XP_031091435.1 protein FAM135B-like isoform X1 [Ipomoea triloba]